MLQTPDRSTKRLLDLADHMEKVPPEMYHQPVYNTCTGRGCIAFHAAEMLGIVVSFAEMKDRLGISQEQANLLFHADAGIKSVMGLMTKGPTPTDAAKAIRHLAVTGEVPKWWTTFVPEVRRDDHPASDVLHDLEPVPV
jgi:hypothetical protein